MNHPFNIVTGGKTGFQTMGMKWIALLFYGQINTIDNNTACVRVEIT